MGTVTFGPNSRNLPVSSITRLSNEKRRRPPERGPWGQLNLEDEWRFRVEGFEDFGVQVGHYLRDYRKMRESELVSHIPGVLCPPLLITRQEFATDISTYAAGNRRVHCVPYNGQLFLAVGQVLYRTVSTTDPSLETCTPTTVTSDILSMGLCYNSDADRPEIVLGMATGRSLWLTGPTASPATTTNMGGADDDWDAIWGAVWMPNPGLTVLYLGDGTTGAGSGVFKTFDVSRARAYNPAADTDHIVGFASNTAIDMEVPLGGFAVGEFQGKAYFVIPDAPDTSAITKYRRLWELSSFDLTGGLTVPFATQKSYDFGFSIKHAAVWGAAGIVAAGDYSVKMLAGNGTIVDLNIFGGQGPTSNLKVTGIAANWPELLAFVENNGATTLQVWRLDKTGWSALSERKTIAGTRIPSTGNPLDFEGQRRLYHFTPSTTNTEVDRMQVLEANLNPLEHVAAAGFAVNADGTYKVLTTPDLILPEAMKLTCIGGIFYGSQDWPPTANSDVRIRVSDDGGSNWNTVHRATTPLTAAGPTLMTPGADANTNTPFAVDYQIRLEIGINNVSGAPAIAVPFELWFTPQAASNGGLTRPKEIIILELDAATINGRGEWSTLRDEIEAEAVQTPASIFTVRALSIRATWRFEYQEAVGDPGSNPVDELIKGKLIGTT